VKEAAAILVRSPTALYNAIAAGRLAVVREGRRIYIPVGAIEAYRRTYQRARARDRVREEEP